MKNILVPTDFSKNARAAEEYALHLAVKAQANIILFNAYPAHTLPVNETIVWPHTEPVSPQWQSISRLQARVDELKLELAEIKTPAYKPSFVHLGGAGPLENQLYEVAIEYHIWLVIMGTRGESLANNLLFGSNVFKVLDNIDCPVLIIPQHAQYKDAGKIAYASDLKSDNFSNIEWLKEFATISCSGLSIVHVSREAVSAGVDLREKTAAQLPDTAEDIPLHIRYAGGENIKGALGKITGERDIGILAMVHRKYGFFETLFHDSTSHKMIKKTSIPVLILPEETGKETT